MLNSEMISNILMYSWQFFPSWTLVQKISYWTSFLIQSIQYTFFVFPSLVFFFFPPVFGCWQNEHMHNSKRIKLILMLQIKKEIKQSRIRVTSKVSIHLRLRKIDFFTYVHQHKIQLFTSTIAYSSSDLFIS